MDYHVPLSLFLNQLSTYNNQFLTGIVNNSYSSIEYENSVEKSCTVQDTKVSIISNNNGLTIRLINKYKDIELSDKNPYTLAEELYKGLYEK